LAKVIMYSKDPCPYCVNAKRLLNEKGVSFEEIDLTDQPEEMQRIKNETGWRTVPIIMINDELIGGYMDMKALDESGELDKLLQKN
jgi:glutaredoxin 3